MFFRIQLSPTLAVMLGLLAASVHAQQSSTRPPIAPAPAPAQQAAAAEPLHALTQTFQKGGVRNCLQKVELVTRFLTGKSPSGIAVFPLTEKTDESALSVSMEIAMAGQTPTGAYAGVTYAPRPQGCTAVYETVNWFPSKCDDLMASQNYASLKPSGPLQGQIKTMSNNPNMRMMFMPAGNGCVVIKKEVVH